MKNHESFLGTYASYQTLVILRHKLIRILILITVAKIFAFALIALICIDTVTSAPVTVDDTTQTSLKPKNTKNPLHRKKAGQKPLGKKNLERMKSLLDNEAVEEWTNPCNSIEWSPNLATAQNYNESYHDVRQLIAK